MAKNKKMILGAFLYPAGYHIASWRHPDTCSDFGINFNQYLNIAKISERGKFDFIFQPDSLAVRGEHLSILCRGAHNYVAQLEPISIMSSLASVTKNIGLIATATTTYNAPFHIARNFASLDHISNGRAGWNLVTSQNKEEAANFGFEDHLDHDLRYSRAEEFIKVVKGLWNSWDKDAFIRDKETGIFFDKNKVHYLNHKGPNFQVRGPLNIPKTPQGHPIIAQAGASPSGKKLAGSASDIVFTAQNNLKDLKSFCKDVRGISLREGRDPSSLKILTGVFPFVGRTQKEAEAKFSHLQSLIDPVVGLALLNSQIGEFDLSRFPLDGPLPEIPKTNASTSRRNLLIDLARRENLTIRELYMHVAGARGHWQIIGTPEKIANELEYWFVEGGIDGFIIMAPTLPKGLEEFVNLVVPELQKRGIFRKIYMGKTLRENLELPL